MGSRPQESPSGLTQLSSAPTRWPSGLRSALSGHELSRGSAQDSRPSPRQASSLTASPVRRSKLPPKALLSKASHHPGRALPGPQTGIPKPSPQVPCPRLSGSLEAGPTSDPGRPEVWGGPTLGSTLQVRRRRTPEVRGLPGPPAAPVRAPAAAHPGSRAGSHIRRRRRSCSAAKSGPRRRPRPRQARAARGASPRAGSRASQPPSG